MSSDRPPYVGSSSDRPPYVGSFIATPLAEKLSKAAANYIRWMIQKRAEPEAWTPLLDALQVFSSHFAEWAQNLTIYDIYQSIPILGKPPGGLGDPYMVTKTGGLLWETKYASELATAHPLPPVVATVVTLATQWKLLQEEQGPTTGRFSSFGSNLKQAYPANNLFQSFDFKTLESRLGHLNTFFTALDWKGSK